MKKSLPIILAAVLAFPLLLQGQWQSAQGPEGGTINTLYRFNNFVFAGTTGGIFRSSDGGQSWTSCYGGVDPSGVYCFVDHGGELYAGTAEQYVRLSTDGGVTWSRVASENGTQINDLVSAGGALYSGSLWSGVYRTTNRGASWEERNNGLPQTRCRKLFGIGNTLLVGLPGGGLYRSTDGAANWTDVSSSAPPGEVRAACVHLGKVYAYFAGKGIHVSTDEGETWNLVNNAQIVSMLYSDAARIYAVGANKLSYSDDGGTSWTQRNLIAGTTLGRAVLFMNGRLLVGDNARGVSVSTDDGVNWSPSSTGLSATMVNTVLRSGSYFFAGVSSAGLFRSSDGGATWTSPQGLSSINSVRAMVDRAGTVFCGTNIGIFSTTDAGDTWQNAPGGAYPITCLFSGPAAMYAGTSDGRVLVSTNNGANWSLLADLGTHENINAIIDNGTVIMASTTSDGLIVSTDGGAQWAKRNNGISGSPSSQCLAYQNGVWYTGRAPGFFTSTDNGLNWTETMNPIRTGDAYRMIGVNGGLIIGTYNQGMYFYDTVDSVWSEISDGYGGSGVEAISEAQGTVLLGTYANGVWKRQLDELRPEPKVTPGAISVDFGTIGTGSVGLDTVTVQSTGDGTVRLRSWMVTGPDAPAFSVSLTGKDILYTGESAGFALQFKPTEARSHTAELIISVNDPTTPEYRISLSGMGIIAPSIRVVPVANDFGTVETGSMKEKVFSVFNDGTDTLDVQLPTLTGRDAASFSLAGTAMQIPPSDLGSIAVQFKPRSVGRKEATLVLNSNDPGHARVEIPLTGNAIIPQVPDIAVDRSAIAFPTTTVGERSSERVKVSNKGGVPLSIRGTMLTGNGSAAYVVRDGDTTTIAPGASWEFTVEFTPPDAIPFSATLTIYSNDPDSPAYPVFLNGTGVGAIEPQIELERSTINFASIPIGASREESLKIENVGLASLTLINYALQGVDAGQFALVTGNPVTLDPGQVTTITLAFTPTSGGMHSADLIIHSNDPVTPNALVTLIGHAAVTGVEDDAHAPMTVLLGNHPNPAVVETTIPFVLRRAGHVRVELFDLLGRSALLAADAEMASGKHALRIDVSTLPDGVYLCRLSSAGEVRTRRLVVRGR
ncbi:MAG: choice-of-anchor D domain-containing protein [Bacteroidetes bacterium]|nr:choice-of-anchor D domain-containing protein [Bacteroidota bacterium]